MAKLKMTTRRASTMTMRSYEPEPFGSLLPAHRGMLPRPISFLTARSPEGGGMTGKHYAQVVINSDKPRPELPDVAKATADQLRAVWDPFIAQAAPMK